MKLGKNHRQSYYIIPIFASIAFWGYSECFPCEFLHNIRVISSITPFKTELEAVILVMLGVHEGVTISYDFFIISQGVGVDVTAYLMRGFYLIHC